MERHDPEVFYECLICNKLQKVKDSLRKHIKQHAIEKNAKQLLKPLAKSAKKIKGWLDRRELNNCEICGKLFKNQSRLRLHIGIHDPTSEHPCHICGKTFRMKNSLHTHLALHNKNEELAIVGKEILESNQLQFKSANHLQSFSMNFTKVLFCTLLDGTDAYICRDCELVFTSMEELRVHVYSAVHARDPYAFLCLICNKHFASKTAISLHMKKIHDPVERQKEKRTCVICGLQLLNRNNLNKHMRIHTGEKPFRCDTCGYRCIQSGTLKVHMRIHDVERVTVDMCAICGKSFTHKSAFFSHMRTAHSDARPYTCTQCDQTFKTNEVLKRHCLTHSNIRTHVCPYCGKAFLRRTNLAVHVKIHTGERPHVCSVCSKGFLQKHVRDSHMKTHDVNRI